MLLQREATPPIQIGTGANGNGRQNVRGRSGRGGRGNRGERGAGDSEKQQVMMKSMAHAWLKHEVEGLEEKLESSTSRNGVNGINHEVNGFSAVSDNNTNKYE